MRILLVEPDFDDNGAVRVSLDRASRWQALGAEVTLFFVSGQNRGARVAVPRGVRVVIGGKGLRSARWMLPGSMARGWRLARQADVVVAGREMASGLLIGTLLAKLARRPLAVTVHSNVEAALAHHGTPRHRRNVLACLRRADLVTPVARGLVEGLRALGIAPGRIKVIENGFEPQTLRSSAAGAPPIELPPGRLIVGLGRLSEQKGFDVLIRAHALALRRGAPAHRILIAGEGPDAAALADLAEELGVADSVTFAGFLADPYPVLARAELFVLPSRWEGFPLALAEATLLGVPTVAADCEAGPGEILDGGQFGDLVKVDDAAALADRIVRHLHDPERLKAMASAGAAFVETRYSADRAAREHLDALRQLAGGSVRGATSARLAPLPATSPHGPSSSIPSGPW